ncbi:MAG: SDR family oxidoreductase [Nannocystaceae bacterium]
MEHAAVDMKGKTVVLTGGNAGIGKEAAIALARMGAQVAFTSRDAGRGAAALAEIRERSGSDDVRCHALDLASLASVRACAAELLDRYPKIDVLLNNAGLVLGERRTTVDGFEMTFGVNHLGHFALTALLVPRLGRSAPARIVTVSSEAHRMARGMPWDDLQAERSYRAFLIYSRSKLANILFTRALARRLEGTRVTANALHPGYVASSFAADGDLGGITERLAAVSARLFAITPEQGARTSVYLASSPEVEGKTGGYYARCKPRTPTRFALDDAAAERLWEVSEALTGCTI